MVAVELAGTVDQPDEAERLGGVAQLPSAGGVVLLAEHADVVAQSQQPLKQRSRLVATTDPGQRVDQPETARQERSLAAGETVVAGLGVIAQQQTVAAEVALDRVHGAHDAVVVIRQEADSR